MVWRELQQTGTGWLALIGRSFHTCPPMDFNQMSAIKNLFSFRGFFLAFNNLFLSVQCTNVVYNFCSCRVPSRLPSEIELRQRAVEEEEAVSSIVEEVNFTIVMVMVKIMMSMMALKTKRL